MSAQNETAVQVSGGRDLRPFTTYFQMRKSDQRTKVISTNSIEKRSQWASSKLRINTNEYGTGGQGTHVFYKKEAADGQPLASSGII